jgi:hypothetical protein
MGVNLGITHGGKETGKGILENRDMRKIFGTKRTKIRYRFNCYVTN